MYLFLPTYDSSMDIVNIIEDLYIMLYSSYCAYICILCVYVYMYIYIYIHTYIHTNVAVKCHSISMSESMIEAS